MSLDKKPSFVLDVWEKTFTQEANTCTADGREVITISQEDGGAGPFWILQTQCWAIESIEDFTRLLREAGVEEGQQR